MAEGLAQYIVGSKQQNLVVVMDNVDKMDLDSQLDAFQLTLWFMERTKAFTILQMRDETYERYKNKPPLDTFRAGIAFHIAPPRFIDVVKRRLELGLEYLNAGASEKQTYLLDNGLRVVLPKGDLGYFLKELYGLIFGRRTNVARVLEALAGRDVRKALEMFVSIVTSGHLSTSAITSNVRGQGTIPITEHQIIKILMRTDYRFFSDNSGFVSNLLYYDNDWVRPDNFLLSEVLYFLSMNRKRSGEIGLEGYIIAWKLCTTMKAEDVTDTLELALTASGCESAQVAHRPRLLSDNGSSYIAGDLAEWLEDRGIRHIRGAPFHPQTQGKIERWHQTLKNRILPENYYLPGDLEAQINAFVDHYNHQRYHEAIGNLTSADVYFGRGQTILLERERIKRQTIQRRRLNHRAIAA